MKMPRRDNPTANSRDRRSYEFRNWTVVQTDLPLATDAVSVRTSRLANVHYCLIRLLFLFSPTTLKYAVIKETNSILIRFRTNQLFSNYGIIIGCISTVNMN